jgi:hypothetical protein
LRIYHYSYLNNEDNFNHFKSVKGIFYDWSEISKTEGLSKEFLDYFFDILSWVDIGNFSGITAKIKI